MKRARGMPALDPRLAVTYLRVSTEDQQLGPEAQRAAIGSWAAREDIKLAGEFTDQGVSGAAPIGKRPGLLAALEALRERGAGLLIAAKRDRLARDVVAAATIERMAERIGARVVTADGVSADGTPEGQLMRTMIDAFAQYERALIAARTVAALRAKAARGERTGNVPFGFELDPENPQRLRQCAAEQATLAEARRLAASGMNCAAIARELNRTGFRDRGRGWDQPRVWRLIHARPDGRAYQKPVEGDPAGDGPDV